MSRRYRAGTSLLLLVSSVASTSCSSEPSQPSNAAGGMATSGEPEPEPGPGAVAPGGQEGGGAGGAAPGTTGAANEAGAGNLPLSGVGGASMAEGPIISDDYATGVTLTLHPDVNTLLIATWSQPIPSDETWLEFTFEDGNVMRSRPSAGAGGPRRDVVLGVPGETDVTVRVVNRKDGVEYRSSDYQARTGAVPGGVNGMPVATIGSYDAALASPDRWLFGSVEASTGGGDVDYYRRTFWLYIMDRKGRVVWYYADPGSNATSSFQRIARDGEYIWFEKRCYGCGNYAESVVKMTLDRAYLEEVPVPGLADAIDVTDDGGLLYDANNELREMSRDGTVRTIWSCRQALGQNFNCYTNTINWNALGNTVLMSFPAPATVVEVDRQSGQLIGQYGSAPGSWAFAPPLSTPPATWGFGFQHFANITSEGTLLLSSHMPGGLKRRRGR